MSSVCAAIFFGSWLEFADISYFTFLLICELRFTLNNYFINHVCDLWPCDKHSKKTGVAMDCECSHSWAVLSINLQSAIVCTYFLVPVQMLVWTSLCVMGRVVLVFKALFMRRANLGYRAYFVSQKCFFGERFRRLTQTGYFCQISFGLILTML